MFAFDVILHDESNSRPFLYNASLPHFINHRSTAGRTIHFILPFDNFWLYSTITSSARLSSWIQILAILSLTVSVLKRSMESRTDHQESSCHFVVTSDKYPTRNPFVRSLLVHILSPVHLTLERSRLTDELLSRLPVLSVFITSGVTGSCASKRKIAPRRSGMLFVD